MDLDRFKATLELDAPPEGLGPPLQALWHQQHGDWDKAHRLAQAQRDKNGAWVHAYLHRVEGDQSNAGYWYRRAGKPHASVSLKDEWDEIVRSLCSGSG